MSNQNYSPEMGEELNRIAEGQTYYAISYQDKDITIPTEIDSIDLINAIAAIDVEVREEFDKLPTPKRFEDDFETRQRYIAETARIAGVREGLKLVVSKLVQQEVSVEPAE